MSIIERTAYCQKFIKSNPVLSTIAFDTIAHFYNGLIDCIIDHNHLYYIEAEPIVSDKEYDDLYSYLLAVENTFPQLISQNSPTQQLINQIAEWFEKASHAIPLLSLENSYNAHDLLSFDEFIVKRTPQIDYLVQPKFDGISAEIIYKDGKFHQAITRGDGKIGEDITRNTKTIKNLPKSLKGKMIPSFLSLRGEIMMPKSTRKELNKQRELEGLTPFANTRNAASGSMKLLDSGEVAKRGLVCYIFDILTTQGEIRVDTWVRERELLGARGLPVYDREKETGNIQDIIAICEDENTLKDLQSSDLDFDGLVVKVNQLHARKELWSTEHHPRWAMAYKFPAQQVATQIESIDFQIGRTWIVTPVANLTPVALSGVTISRVSLHNFDFIAEKDIKNGDRVWIQRSGEVIPYVVASIKERRENNKKLANIHPPQHCPVCGHPIRQKEGHYFCSNPHCPAILAWKLDYFVSKQCMNIDGVGGSIIDILVEQWFIKTLPDLYSLTTNEIQQQIKRIPWFGDKKINHIAKELEQSKNIPLRRFLNALSLPWIGKKTAQSISQEIATTGHQYCKKDNEKLLSFRDIESLLTDPEYINQVEWIGTIITQGLQEYFANTLNKESFYEFEKIGIKPYLANQKKEDWLLSWQYFSLTWSFPIARDSLVTIFEEQWATFQSSPWKKTHFMLIGEKPGSKKQKAEKLGITIYSDREAIKKEFPFVEEKQQTPSFRPPTGLFG